MSGAPRINNLVMFVDRASDDTNLINLNPGHKDWGPREWGVLTADIVRHAANMLGVHENEVWAGLDEERDNPSTDIVGGRKQ